jgi:hypothetical protein
MVLFFYAARLRIIRFDGYRSAAMENYGQLINHCVDVIAAWGGVGGDMLETQRFHVKWGRDFTSRNIQPGPKFLQCCHKCGNQNVYNFINIEPRLKL